MAAAAALGLAESCAPVRRVTRAGCMPLSRAVDAVELVVNRTASVPPTCPLLVGLRVRGSVLLTPSEDGLRIEMDVADPSFVAVTRRGARDERDDVAVVFPSGEGPGRPALELAVDPRPWGYRVDDVVPWEAWGLQGPAGAFRLVCALFDRGGDGAEAEVRLDLHARVQRRP